MEERYVQKNKVKYQLSKAPANPHLPSTLLAQKVKGLTAWLFLHRQCSGFVSSLQLPKNECQDAWVTSPASTTPPSWIEISPANSQYFVRRLLPLATKAKMAADGGVQTVEVEDDFLEERLSKPIFYSPEVEEAISQVTRVKLIFVKLYFLWRVVDSS